MDENLDHWFEREILPHERALVRFISRRVTGVEVFDVLQEVYVRVYAHAKNHQCTSPKPFLYQVAENLLNDRARRNRVVSIDLVEDPDSLNVLVDYVTPERAASDAEELVRLKKCFDKLSNRRREAVWLQKIEGRSQRETADHLGITEGTVEQTLVQAMRQLTRCFKGETSEAASAAPQKIAALGVDHGK